MSLFHDEVLDPAALRRRMTGYGAWLEIDLDRLGANLDRTAARVGVEVMPVVKNNAYGHGIVPVTRYLIERGIRWFLVAKTYEASLIRQTFPESRVLNMDALFGDEAYQRVVRDGITQAVFTREMAEKLNELARRAGREASVFVKVDTGLRRVGVHHEAAPDFVDALGALQHLRIEGLFSSFMQHPEQDEKMLARFLEATAEVERRGVEIGFRTIASTNAIFHLPESWLDMVRPAMCLFGVHPFPGDEASGLALEQVLELKARIEYVKEVQAGDSVTYFGSFTASRPMTVGTLHLGFYDGLPRELTNKLRIRVGDRFVPGVGTIALNHCLLDLTGTGAAAGDVVTLYGREGENTLVEMAKAAGWMVYSLMNHLSPFLPRVYMRDGEPVSVLDPAGRAAS